MAEAITMPKLGFDMREGVLIRWVKNEGEAINKGDILAEIETDKATVEVESHATGTVRKLFGGQGDSIPVGATRLAVARDRHIWMATSSGVARFSPRRGTFEEIPIPALGAPVDITVGPDGNIWALAFTNVARVTLRGEVTLFPLPSTPFSSSSDRIVAGPDGNLWYTAGVQLIHRLTLTGVVTDFSVPSSGTIFGLAAGPDDAIWFTQAGGGPNENRIGRITTDGVVSTVVQLPDSTLPFPSAPDNMPIDITAGPDGRMYFTTYLVVPKNYIGAVSPRGQLQRFEIPTAGAASFGITSGPDGNVWFTENFNNSIGRVEIASCHHHRR